MLPLSDEDLVLALLKRDGKQYQPAHKMPGLGLPGDCPYFEKYFLRGEICPWCVAQERREGFAKRLVKEWNFLQMYGAKPNTIERLLTDGDNQRHLNGIVYASRTQEANNPALSGGEEQHP